MTNVKIPTNIEFSSQILRFPALRDMGIDKKITVRSIVETNFEIGDWVNRNDEIINIKIELYKKNEKPKFSLKSDDTEFYTFSFKSPVSGLIIGYKKESLVDKPWGYSLFGYKYTFPVLLIPKYEPQITDTYTDVYLSLWQILKNEGPRLHTWDREKGNVRMNELYTNNQINNSDNEPKSKLQIEEYSDVVDKETIDEFYTSTIEHLRANDLTLRDKLLHLVKNNYSNH